MNTKSGPQYEFRPRCAECAAPASTIQLFNDSGKWRLIYQGPEAGNGNGDDITPESARAIIAGFSEPYVKAKIRAADFYDDGGFCLECGQFYCPTHWNISATGGGKCPKGHFKSLDPHWSPES
jgi:hypothetical protein